MEKVVTKPRVFHLTALSLGSYVLSTVFLKVQPWPYFSFVGSLGLTVWLTSVEKVAFVCCDFVFRVFGIPLPSLMQAPNLQQKQRIMRCSCGIE